MTPRIATPTEPQPRTEPPKPKRKRTRTRRTPTETLGAVHARSDDHYVADADADLTRTLAAAALHLGARFDALTIETRRWAEALEAIDARLDGRRNGTQPPTTP